MILAGRAHRFGDHIDTDVILPGKFLRTTDPAELAAGCFLGLGEDFSTRVAPGDIVVAGENFGCGSSREHAALAIKATGIACIVAVSFSRIFYRNAINLGLPAITCPKVVPHVADGAALTVDLLGGAVGLEDGRRFLSSALAPELMAILDAGGLVPFMRNRLGAHA